MTATAINEEQLKALLKSVLVEVLEECRDLLRDILEEALEDIGLVYAIEEGAESAPISRETVFEILGASS